MRSAEKALTNIFIIAIFIIGVIIGSMYDHGDNCVDSAKVQKQEIQKQKILKDTAVKVGQVWRYISKNPFEEPVFWEILELKQGYARIRQPKNNEYDVFTSVRVDFFEGMDLIKNNQIEKLTQTR